jgi:hypothetical protein
LALGHRALERARREIATRPVGNLVQVDTNAANEEENVSAPTIRRARLIADGVARASKYLWGSSTCLTRSIAIQQRLNAEGIFGSRMRVGVARQNGAFVAHAWIELDGRVIGDDALAVQMYTPLEGLSVSQFE